MHGVRQVPSPAGPILMRANVGPIPGRPDLGAGNSGVRQAAPKLPCATQVRQSSGQFNFIYFQVRLGPGPFRVQTDFCFIFFFFPPDLKRADAKIRVVAYRVCYNGEIACRVGWS